MKMNDNFELAISDEKISLYRNKMISENIDLSLSQAECFEIITKSNENVGIISYRYNNDANYIDYSGNVNYRIKEEYRGKGYAKRALLLMIEALKKNTKFDQPLYVASTSYNENYLNVIKECGGLLIHSGLVPEHVIGARYDREMRNVELYQIDIEKEKKKER